MEAIYDKEEYHQILDLVRTMLSDVVSPRRITHFAHKCYAPIVLDGCPRRTICRVYISGKLHLGIISPRKVETRVAIKNTAEIARYTRDLHEVVKKYDGMG